MQYTLFVVLAPLAAVAILGVGVYAWRYRQTPGAVSLIRMFAVVFCWLIFNTIELLAPTPEATLAWAKFNYLFMTLTPVFWLVFALDYTGRHQWLKPSRLAALLLIPLATTSLAFTNDLHRLIWRSYEFPLVVGNHPMDVITEYGAWIPVHLAYSYVVVVLGAFFIAREGLASFKLYRRQSTWLLFGVAVGLLTNVVYVFELIPGLVMDYSAISFAVAGIAYTFGMFRDRLLDLKPLARNQLIDSMSDAMLVLDWQNRVVDLNAAAESVIGRQPDDAIGQRITDLLPAWQSVAEQAEVAGEVHTELSAAVGGSTRWYDVRVSPLVDQRERPTGQVALLHDITRRKHVEMERERLIGELDAYAHTVAHDLKSPLAVVTGYASLLVDDRHIMASEQGRECVEIIVRTAGKMSSIVNNLLLMASVRRLDEIAREPLDMSLVTLEARMRLAHELEEAGAELSMPESWPAAVGFAAWVEEVWVNYLSNAVKYGGSPPRLELGAEKQVDGMVCFWVQDNGQGLSSEAQAGLFDEFKRYSRGNAEGHGLGLSIVRRIVEKLGGEVGVESAVGQGSRFFFTLPAADEASLQPEMSLFAQAERT